MPRVYCGMHYRKSVEVGATLGEQVANWVAANYFRCVADKNDDGDHAWRRRRHDDWRSFGWN
jgi:hypothetical protein